MATAARAARDTAKKTIASSPATDYRSTGAATEDADDVLVQQFTRELKRVLRDVRDAKRSAVDAIVPAQQQQKRTRHDATAKNDVDAADEADEVAYCGPLSQTLAVLIDRLVHRTPGLTQRKKLQLLLEFGDRFLALRECRAASRFFFDHIVAAYESSARQLRDDTATDSTVQQQHEPSSSSEPIEAEQAATSTAGTSVQPLLKPNDVFIGALYGKAMSLFYEQQCRDARVQFPGTLEKMLAALRMLQSGMEIATALELASAHSHAWLVLNGSVLIYAIAAPLSRLGFARDVVTFLKWTIVATESIVTLSTTTYVHWRLQLFAATCECYERMAAAAQTLDAPHNAQQHRKAALRCAEYARTTVLRLKTEEELDLPLPRDVAATLKQAQIVADMLVARARAAASDGPLSKRKIEHLFPAASAGERIRVALDALEGIAQSDVRCIGALTAPSTPAVVASTTDLLEYALELVAPLISATDDASSSADGGDAAESATAIAPIETLQQTLPLALHLMLLRHCFRLGRLEQLRSVVTSARARVQRCSLKALRECDRAQCLLELALFDALAGVKQPLTASFDVTVDPTAPASVPAQLLQLIKTGVTLPPARAIQQLAAALTNCLTYGAGSMARTKRDLVLATALLLWHDYALPIVRELDASDPSAIPMRLVKVASDVALAVHSAFQQCAIDDLVVYGHVALRLASLLRLQRKFHVATQTLRAALDCLNRHRDALALGANHFDATTTREAAALSCATMSCTLDPSLARSDATGATATARDTVGVAGTGSQFGSLHSDVCCLQTDLLLLLFELELEAAHATDALPTAAESSSVESPQSLVKTTEERLLLECRSNGYAKVLLSLQRMRHSNRYGSNSAKANAALADQAMKLLARIDVQERTLQTRVKQLVVSPPGPIAHSQSHSTTAAAGATSSSSTSSANVLPAPVVLMRSSTAVCVRVLALLSHGRTRKVAYYMVFAKSAGAGTAVSLTNNALPGTAEPVYAPQLCVTVSGLVPNERYVFAAAAFDAQHAVIDGIGQTSEPVVAVHPLPLTLLYGYLAQTCDELALVSRAKRAAAALYDSIVSRTGVSRALWQASPFYRDALRRDVVARLPVPVMNLAVQAVLILCRDEVGDSERDGRLRDPEHRPLLATQVDVLEASRRVAIGVELASAAENADAVRLLCFKGYRVLLPLLHLPMCNGLTFAPLVTLYTALHTIPRADWDVDTTSVASRIAFELFRVGRATRHLGAAVLPLIVRDTLHTDAVVSTDAVDDVDSGSTSNELRSLRDAIAIHEALIRGVPAANTTLSVAPAAAANGGATKTAAAPVTAKGTHAAPAATSASSTPQATPRLPTSSARGADDRRRLPPLSEILEHAGFSVHESLKALETLATAAPSDLRSAEYMCKLACVAIEAGEDSAAAACLAAIKLRGNASSELQATLEVHGGTHLLPDVAAVAAGDDVAAVASDSGSAPSSARSVKSPRQGAASVSKTSKDEMPATPRASESVTNTPRLPASDADDAPAASFSSRDSGRCDDDVMCLWGGEVFFLEALLLFRRLVAMRSAQGSTLDVCKGPRFDAVFELLHGSSDSAVAPRLSRGSSRNDSASNLESTTVVNDVAADSKELLSSESAAAAHRDTSNTDSSNTDSSNTDSSSDELMHVFVAFLAKMSAACELYRRAKAWHALQATCQYVWNAVWVAWIAPGCFGTDRDGGAASSTSPSLLLPPEGVDRLAMCVDALLEMLEAVSTAVRAERALGRTDVTLPTTTLSTTATTGGSTASTEYSKTACASTAVVTTAASTMPADVAWIVDFVAYAVQALCAHARWADVVRVGMSFHRLVGNDDNASGGARFAERTFPVLLVAQQQLLAHARTELAAAEHDRAAYVRAFTEREATRKTKKKSRLVVDDVLTAEELAFRTATAAMDAHLEELRATSDSARDSLQNLTGVYNALTKSMNKCVQALDTAHTLVEQYRRRQMREADEKSGDDGGSAARGRRAVVAAYSHCIAFARQKRQQRLLCQAYQELGDFYLASCRDTKMAVKSWHACLDNAFRAVHAAGPSWRGVVATSEHALIDGEGLDVTLLSCTALAKLVLHATATSCFQALEYALMATTVVTRLFAASLPHPTRAFLFGSYELGADTLSPERALLGATDCVAPLALVLALTLVPEVLLANAHYATAAMPLVALYESLGRYTLESASHVANARRLRVEALAQCGRISEALATLAQLVDGVNMVSTREGYVRANTVVPLLPFDDRKPLSHDANAVALAWFTAVDLHDLHAALARSYAAPLVLEILVTALRLAVRLARYDSDFVDSSVSPLSAAADRMAQTVIALLDERAASLTEPTANSCAGTPTWDSVHIVAMRCEVVLAQSRLAYIAGQWSHARDLSEVAMTVRVAGSNSDSATTAAAIMLELDDELPCSLFRRASTLVAQCRVQALECDLAQGRYDTVLAQAAIALRECSVSGEALVSEQIELLRVQALVFLGARDDAERALEELRVAATARSTTCSLVFVQSLLMANTVLRARVLLRSECAALEPARMRLLEAERVLDDLLERDGWIGVGVSNDVETDKRLNVYHPAVPIFVAVKATLAQSLVEYAPPAATSSAAVEASSAATADHVLRVIGSGLRATQHTTSRVGAAKALMLLLKGAVLKKVLVNDCSRRALAAAVVGSDTITADEQLTRRLADCAAALRESIETSMHSGGYDRRLIRMALLELVDLYSHKLLPDAEDAHTQAAFHYLGLAVATARHESTLFETLELQSGTIAALDKLPLFIAQAIADDRVSGGDNGSADAAATAEATAGKKASGTGVVGLGASTSAGAPVLDAARVVNYFVRLARTQHALPTGSALAHEMAQQLHAFLIHHHASYATRCCLRELPDVPTADPAIHASLVCAQWRRDLTPAIVVDANGSDAATRHGRSASPSAAALTLHFTLGTTRIEICCSEAHATAATTRMEHFLNEPLLSSTSALDEQRVQRIGTALSRLRARIEDDESLVIDRSTFAPEFTAILRRVQQLLAPHRDSAALNLSTNDSVDAALPTSLLLTDVFGNPIDVPCTLDTVRSVEHLFSVHRGLDTSDNALCYFLRDLLEPAT